MEDQIDYIMRLAEDFASDCVDRGYVSTAATSHERLENFIREEFLDIDKIANFIRTIDGNNTMDAGELAEKIVEFIKKEF